ncbi:hypothetical protein [Lebetimonas sp. JH292]|uniref:hypothetical protein n=1 Tax=Lebetimonas sp. JH292 TaxID=990068 RepID=UPI0004649469|nr:hypothetical protein [Lebetimonas sp. JH292]
MLIKNRNENFEGLITKNKHHAKIEIETSYFPKSLNKFFFFDGEKIQELSNFENKELKEMLESVLKLDIYDFKNFIKKI